MTQRELAAAGIADPMLRQAYSRCRALNAAHGRTYFLATRLLPPGRRPAVHALYGFARYVDDLVDHPGLDSSPGAVESRIAEAEHLLTEALAAHRDTTAAVDASHDALAGARAPLGDTHAEALPRTLPPDGESVALALADTVHRYAIDPALFSAFLDSMRMDLRLRDYPDRDALRRYTYGSAQVIGLQMLPVLGTVTAREDAAPFAAALGDAFQLTNFLRDVAEDLDRGRVYLPADELAAFGVDRDRLAWCRANGFADARVRAALVDQVAATRAVYHEAAPGVDMLAPWARPCVATAFTLYSEILDRIEYRDYNVFAGRAAVGAARKVRVAAPAAARAWWIRRAGPAHRQGAARASA